MSEGTAEERELRTLMTQYQRGDAEALDALIGRLAPPLLRYFSASGFGRTDPEDMLQDCWLRIHRSRHTYRASEPLLPWIYTIARRTRLDAYRKRRRLESREVLVETLPERAQPAMGETLCGFSPEGQDVARLIAGLPESQREVIVMLKVTGMSLEEVARATSSTVGAVKQRAHRAYATMRRVLGKDRGDAHQSA
jgi:RNA polymerase sigma-70 factor, ECF subfamily